MPFPLLVAAVVLVGRVAVAVVVRSAPVIIKAAPKIGKEVVKKGSEVVKKAASKGPKVGNTGLNKYLDKAMNKLSKVCQKAVKKLGAHIHGRKGDVIEKGSKVESNHIIQNAMLEGARGKGSEICPDYKASRAPSMPLGKYDHGVTTKDQRETAMAHRRAGTQPTYGEAREQAKKQVERTGASKRDAECLMKFTDEVFRQLCPDLVNQNKPMRTPQR